MNIFLITVILKTVGPRTFTCQRQIYVLMFILGGLEQKYFELIFVCFISQEYCFHLHAIDLLKSIKLFTAGSGGS